METGILMGKVTDVDGQPVQGSVVSVYFDTNSRRKPDFMSLGADKEGLYSLVLPQGRYWAVARYNSEKKIGPLTPGGKYSGEPAEVIIHPRAETQKDFTVADIRDVARMGTDTGQDMVKLEGRIIDAEGKPVSMAYVFANKNNFKVDYPNYLSAWSDENGRFSMYLPQGKYYVGTAAVFPPVKENISTEEMILDSDRLDVDIMMRLKGD